MMGSENDDGQETHLYTTIDAMENLVLDQPFENSSNNNNDYRQRSMSSNTVTLSPCSSDDPLQTAFTEQNLKDSSSPNQFTDEPYVDPPSYADVTYIPFEADSPSDYRSTTRASSHPFGGNTSSSSETEYLIIKVSDPQKEQDSAGSLVPGGNTFVTYLICTQTNMPEFPSTEFSVRRRFRDFVTLADRLAESYRGYFVPPRPDKNVVESQVMQKNEFIEQRRAALEKYLCRLACHSVIKRSVELKLFLQAPGKLPLPTTIDVASRMLDGAVKLPKQVFGEANHTITAQEFSQPAKGGRDLLRLFKEIRQSVSNEWVGVKPPVVEEDKEFLEKKEKLQLLEQELSNSSQQAEALVKAHQDISETTGQLGLAFTKLSKFESEAPTFNYQKDGDCNSNGTTNYNSQRVADSKCIASAAVKASRLQREANAQSVKHLDKLHEYLGLMQAVHNAFTDRSNALLTVQVLLSDLTNLNNKLERQTAAASKVFGGDKTRNRKIEDLKETIRETESARDCAIKEYEHIKENNKNELERFEAERKSDFSKMLKGFVYNQVGYMEKIASVWEKVAEETSGYAQISDRFKPFGQDH
eukprot:TRINITY_DN908_c0_g1_i1.p1 TRINITY_DN908_c0_g1~~TRINITY_DN908_c0_g1_i1.p1  ORF type:complete len:585 (+),score=130.44 TRINITY_DN908_c0_g1_i1:292-2046(+)